MRTFSFGIVGYHSRACLSLRMKNQQEQWTCQTSMGRVTAVNPLGHTAVPGSFVTHHSTLCPDVGDIAAILVGVMQYNAIGSSTYYAFCRCFCLVATGNVFRTLLLSR